MTHGGGAGENVGASGASGRPASHWERILGEGVPEGSRNEDFASIVGKLLYDAPDITTDSDLRHLLLIAQSVNRANFRPPLDNHEVGRVFESILRAERGRRTVAEVRPNDDPIFPGAGVEGFRLVIYRGEPSRCELYSDAFGAAKGGCVRLSIPEILTPARLAVAVFDQAGVILSRQILRRWIAQDLLQRIRQRAEVREVEPMENRSTAVAGCCLAYLQDTDNVPALREMDPAGDATQLPDGQIAFSLRWLMEKIKYESEKCTRPEVCGVLREAGGEPRIIRACGKQLRVWILPGLEGLGAIANPDFGPREGG